MTGDPPLLSLTRVGSSPKVLDWYGAMNGGALEAKSIPPGLQRGNSALSFSPSDSHCPMHTDSV